MGWTTYPDDENSWYGDDGLKLCRDFIEDFISLYQEDLGRTPTVEELRRTLRTCLMVNFDEDLVDDMTGKIVSDLIIKVKNRPKKIKVEVGDVYAVPLPSGGFGFGRIIHLEDGYELAEYFEYFSEKQEFNTEIVSSGRAFSPMGVLLTEIENGSWKVVWKDSAYKCPDIATLRFVMGEPGRFSELRVGEFGKGTPVSDKQAKGLLSRLPQHPGFVANMLEQHIK